MQIPAPSFDVTNDPALFPLENPNPVFRATADGLILFANRASKDLLASWGVSAQGYLPPEWQQRVANALSAGLNARVSAPCGDRVFELDFVPISAKNYVNVYGRDVTEQEAIRREREALLVELQLERDLAKARAAELETTLDAISEGVVIYDSEGKFVRQNPAALRILGYETPHGRLPIGERAAQMRAVLVDEPEATVERMPVGRALAGEIVRGQLMRLQPVDQPEGLARYVLVSAAPIHDPAGVKLGAVASFSDVTELRRAQDELAKRVEELEALLDLLPAGIAISYDPACKDIRANPALTMMLAMPHDANVSLGAEESRRAAQYRVFDQAGQELTVDELPMQAAAARGTEVRDMLIDILREDGVRLTLLSYAVPLLDAAGQRRGAVGAYMDITELRMAAAERERLLAELQARHRELEARTAEVRALNATLEQRVAERTAELEAIFASLPDAVYIGNSDGIYRCNAVALAYLGCDSIAELQDKIPALASKVQTRYAATGERVPPEQEPFVCALQGEPVNAELFLRNLKTGQDMIVRSACAPIWLDGAVWGAVAINTDITDQKAAERELRTSREQLKQFAHRLVELQENERSYVAKELYDDEGQRLSALLMELVVIEREAHGQPALQEHIRRVKQLADGILADMHSLAVDLRPASLDWLGLMNGLRHYAEKLGSQYDVSIEVEAGGLHKTRLAADTETMLYRIAQEAVMNAIHHSRAGQVGIAAAQHGDRLTLVIEDDGQGFDVADVTRSGALGLLGMRERAEMLGGSLTIESAPGKGTIVYIEAPVSDA